MSMGRRRFDFVSLLLCDEPPRDARRSARLGRPLDTAPPRLLSLAVGAAGDTSTPRPALLRSGGPLTMLATLVPNSAESEGQGAGSGRTLDSATSVATPVPS